MRSRERGELIVAMNGRRMRQRTRTGAIVALCIVAIVVAVMAYVLRPIGSTAFAPDRPAIGFDDRSGLPLGNVLSASGERVAAVSLATVSPTFVTTVIAVEDRRFYAHHGIDAIALARATFEALRARRVVSGGSTIPMQLARLRYGIPHSFLGKLHEMILALRIERGCSKAQILEAYLNRLPMGGNLVGIATGAQAYFNVLPGDLDLAQSAFLAALPNDPTALDPYRSRPALERRRQAILTALEAAGTIGAIDARRAIAERLPLARTDQGIGDAPHLVFRLAREVPRATSKRVRTTIDRDLQRFVTASARDIVAAVRERSVRDAAAIVIDNATGDVIAYVGSADYFDRAAFGQNDGVTALRQPGSTLKPFLYELALERRAIRPTTILADVPTTYAIPNAQAFTPSDYSGTFAGPVRPRIALADSLNVPAVRTLSAIGVDPFLERLHALGFAHLNRSAAYYGLGLTLGSGEVSLEELARAYATIARGGRPVRLRYRYDDPRTTAPPAIGAPADWSLITDILADPYARARSFGVASLLRLPFPSAAKTGTSSDFRDTWTAGYTRDFTVATWVGNFDGTPMRGITGVTGAAPLWNRIMLHLAERREPAPFEPPRGYRKTAICADTGARASADCRAIVDEWLDAGDRRSLALEKRPRAPELHIDNPRDGAVYRTDGTIVVRATAPLQFPISWSVNGRDVAGGRAWHFTLHDGDYAIVARAGSARSTVHVRVSAARVRSAHPGFTIVAR